MIVHLIVEPSGSNACGQLVSDPAGTQGTLNPGDVTCTACQATEAYVDANEGGPEDPWAPLARSSRRALALLGYHIGPACLPGEPEACGGSWAYHTLAHMAALQAVVGHHLAHLACLPHHAELVDDIRGATAADIICKTHPGEGV